MSSKRNSSLLSNNSPVSSPKTTRLSSTSSTSSSSTSTQQTSPTNKTQHHQLRSLAITNNKTVKSVTTTTNEVPPSQFLSEISKQPASTSNNHILDDDNDDDQSDSESNSSIVQLNQKKRNNITSLIKNNSELSSELICPICFELINVAHITKCGHTFCLNCIQTALETTHRCPKCNTTCSTAKDIFPNFTLNQIVERVKEEEKRTKKSKLFKNNSDSNKNSNNNFIQYFNSTQDELNLNQVDQLLSILNQRKQELKNNQTKVTELILHDFLKHLHQVKADELNRLKNELEMVNEDCKKVNDNLLKLKTIKNPENEDNSSTTASSSSPTTIISNKKRTKVHCHFDELSQSYIQSYNRDLTLKEFNIKDCTKNSSIILDKIRETVNKITNCNEMKCIASVNYNTSDTYSLSNIVSAVDFDCSYEHFALAGVTKRIKIYDFGNILSKPNNIHYPQYEMTHLAKLSCISWNKYFKQQIVCSDYEGAVTLWDSEQGTLIRSYQEHDKRCWGVQFCSVDPRLIASASDDTKVKIWSTNSEYSLISLDAKSNVCCVVFKPDSKFHVLFGTADHSIHYYDLRMAKEPVSLFKGHRKAVSYVKFCSETGDEFVSASTDSLLKSWKLNENYCMRSYTGHLNEKNFVGLDSKNGYIVTGSENNNLYLYTNELSKPLLNYRFDESNNNNKRDEGMNDFVSAVCWSNENYLLAANSQGIVKILELV